MHQTSVCTKLRPLAFLLSLSAWALFLMGQALASQPISQDISGWSERIESALRNGKSDEALKEINQAIQASPKQSQLYVIRGSLQFRSGHVAESIPDFDKAIELQPGLKPYLWQRGISLYYAGKYEEGVEQFTTHREVNPNDVENAFWHFLCAAKIDGVEAAQKSVLLSGFDRRVPLMQVQEMIQGKATPDDVVAAAEKSTPPRKGGNYDRFYGYLYVALYYDATGKPDEAKKWMQKCVDEKVDGYMYDVAKVHLALMNQPPTKTK